MRLTSGGYVVEARDGLQFEEEVLGSRREKRTQLARADFSTAVREVMEFETAQCPDTEVARDLYFFVSRFLRKSGLHGELSFISSLGSVADIQHGTDAFFCLRIGGREFVVTLDLYFFYLALFMWQLKEKYPEEFAWLNSGSSLRAMKGFLNEHYAEFQTFLYGLKRRQRGMNSAKRSSNHFLLTPIEVQMGKGLRILGRAIALSFQEQVKGNT